MAKQPIDNALSKAIPRESDNPIVEEYKEEMLRKPAYGARPTIISDEERLCRMERLLAELNQRVEALEKKSSIEEKR